MQLLNWRRPVLSTFSQEWIDAMEDLTGLDIDGDGKVGEQQPKESPPQTPKPTEKPEMIACRFQCGFEHALMEVVCHHELRGGVRSQPPSPPLLPHLRLICTRKGFLLCARLSGRNPAIRGPGARFGCRLEDDEICKHPLEAHSHCQQCEFVETVASGQPAPAPATLATATS